MKTLTGNLLRPCRGQGHTVSGVQIVLLARSSRQIARRGDLTASGATQPGHGRAALLSCRAEALQFDTKVFEAEKVNFAGQEEYIYRGGRDKFKLLSKVENTVLHFSKTWAISEYRSPPPSCSNCLKRSATAYLTFAYAPT